MNGKSSPWRLLAKVVDARTAKHHRNEKADEVKSTTRNLSYRYLLFPKSSSRFKTLRSMDMEYEGICKKPILFTFC